MKTFAADPQPASQANLASPQQSHASSQPKLLSHQELALLWLLGAACFLIVLTHFQSYSKTVADFGDNPPYISAAQAIRHWDLQRTETKQGWGFSYLIAALSTTGLSSQHSLLLICFASSLATVLLVQNLWGPWIAAYFAILNFSWFQSSLLGGSEPLFVLLLFASFWFSRKDRWVIASAFAALATLTRPVGVFALLALGLTLLMRKRYRTVALSTAVAALIGFSYLVPFWVSFHDPLYQFHKYKHEDWQSGSLVTWPFHIIVVSYVYYTGPWTNVIFTGTWIAFAAVGLCMIFGKIIRDRELESSYEQIFTVAYVIFLFSYNSLEWARWDFPRFVIPAIPMLLLSFERWLPRRRYVIYPLCVFCSVLAACSAIGIQKVIGTLR